VEIISESQRVHLLVAPFSIEFPGLSMLRNITPCFIDKKGLRKNRCSRLFFVTFLHKNQGRSSKVTGEKQSGDRWGKSRFRRAACGKLWQTWGKPVEIVWKKNPKLVESLWNSWGEVEPFLNFVNFLNLPKFTR
jgi:hypothetical protein